MASISKSICSDVVESVASPIAGFSLDPLSVSGGVLLLDVNKGLSMNGSNEISSWRNLFDNNDAVQTDAANKPTLSTYNGIDAVYFDGSDWLLTEGSLTVGPLTIIAVFALTTEYPIVGSKVDFLVHHVGFNINPVNTFITGGDTTPKFTVENLGGGETIYVDDTSVSNSSNINPDQMYVAGVIAPNEASSSSVLGIGATYDDFGTWPFKGYITDLAIWNRALSDEEYLGVTNYYKQLRKL